MIIAQLEAREELDLGDEGPCAQRPRQRPTEFKITKNTKLPMHVAVLHSVFIAS